MGLPETQIKERTQDLETPGEEIKIIKEVEIIGEEVSRHLQVRDTLGVKIIYIT